MCRIKLFTIIQITLFFLIGFLTTSAIANDCEPPDTTLTKNSEYRITYLSGPEFDTTKNLFRWIYTIDKLDSKAKNPSHLSFALPYNCNDPLIAEGQISSWVYNMECIGDDKTTLGIGVCNTRVLMLPFSATYKEIYIYTNKNEKGRVSFAINGGGTIYYSDGPIIGPGYDGSADSVPRHKQQVIDLKDDETGGTFTITIFRNESTGCIEDVKDALGNSYPVESPPFEEGYNIEHAGTIEGNQLCSEALLYFPGNTYYIWNGTSWIKVK